MQLLLLLLFVALAACGDDIAVVNLDGKFICPPSAAVVDDTPVWLDPIKGKLDNSYSDALLFIESYQVLVVNQSAVRGRSKAEEELLKAVASGKATFEPVEGTPYLSVVARPEFAKLGMQVVRWLPRGAEGASAESLSKWIVAGCTTIKTSMSCLIQRIHNGFAYEFWYRGPLSQVDQATAVIEDQLDHWHRACNREA